MTKQEKLYQSITDIEEHYLESIDLDCPGQKRIRPLLLAGCLAAALALCSFGYAVYWGVGPADGISFRALTQDFQTVAGDADPGETAAGSAAEKSSLIAEDAGAFAENAVSCATEDGDIPSVYLSPSYMVIFTGAQGGGWTLDAGEQLELSLLLDERQSLTLELGYLLDGRYCPLSTAKGHTFSETFQAPEAGEYYFCVTNRSSSNAVVRGGRIGS